MVLERVQKIIANAGLMSRRRAEELIQQGRVKVNGQVIAIGSKADVLRDRIIVEGRPLQLQKRLYYAFYKPGDCLTTLDDPAGRKTIFHYIKSGERLIPVGRLDFKTEGLLLLTNDGDFANRIMHPRYETKKTYCAFLDKAISKENLAKIERGVQLEDGMTAPAKARTRSPDGKEVEVVIHEGRNRIVIRVFNALGYGVRRLIRTHIGKLSLGNIKPGKMRELSYQEVQMLMRDSARKEL
ncbi:rRNA pseudouridine synthase [Candidatus Woesearchaeota archaeon]|nr:rRNA pseudouridine synthase [Candidatus Woesearchaeota archaeon]